MGYYFFVNQWTMQCFARYLSHFIKRLECVQHPLKFEKHVMEKHAKDTNLNENVCKSENNRLAVPSNSKEIDAF